jgi:hypothetical protein
MKLSLGISIAFLIASQACVAQSSTTSTTQETTISPPFSKGECTVTYTKADKTFDFKVIKREKAESLKQTLPDGKDPAECSDELKADLNITAQTCQVFCNPN